MAGPFQSGNRPNGQLAVRLSSAMLTGDMTTPERNRDTAMQLGIERRARTLPRHRMGRALARRSASVRNACAGRCPGGFVVVDDTQ
ncbi:hypothetical protein BN2475_370018 [Paraburkholderia ribeironis]|uniref:Uncharacterized protein n=1 Tax=Paraburkholderia ribeironis TaxID=1247936 RepID=A0A1N7S516_9BURK|nr:hypothetical protein BN2475_370018 [Paraburkholderia ribeironis]